MDRTNVVGGRVPQDGQKPPPKKEKTPEARAEERERRVRSVQTFFRSIVSEMKRVTWPSREEWVSATLVTVGLVLVVAAWTEAIGGIAQWIFKTGK
jgi:preprotein translocase SecE subunit